MKHDNGKWKTNERRLMIFQETFSNACEVSRLQHRERELRQRPTISLS
jgi:hypothetical protein